MPDASAVADGFYRAFAAHDAKAMGAFYADDARFSDPVFPDLSAREVRAMWDMLLQPGADLRIEHKLVSANAEQAEVEWIAHYHFSRTGRPVVNRVLARMDVSGGLIRRHRDQFSFYRWSSQALGLPGLLLGWSPLIRKKVQAQAAERLRNFQAGQA